MAEPIRIGDFFIKIGAMSLDQVLAVLALQKAGDTERFGSIALHEGYIDEEAISRYLLEAYPAPDVADSAD